MTRTRRRQRGCIAKCNNALAATLSSHIARRQPRGCASTRSNTKVPEMVERERLRPLLRHVLLARGELPSTGKSWGYRCSGAPGYAYESRHRAGTSVQSRPSPKQTTRDRRRDGRRGEGDRRAHQEARRAGDDSGQEALDLERTECRGQRAEQRLDPR